MLISEVDKKMRKIRNAQSRVELNSMDAFIYI